MSGAMHPYDTPTYLTHANAVPYTAAYNAHSAHGNPLNNAATPAIAVAHAIHPPHPYTDAAALAYANHAYATAVAAYHDTSADAALSGYAYPYSNTLASGYNSSLPTSSHTAPYSSLSYPHCGTADPTASAMPHHSADTPLAAAVSITPVFESLSETGSHSSASVPKRKRQRGSASQRQLSAQLSAHSSVASNSPPQAHSALHDSLLIAPMKSEYDAGIFDEVHAALQHQHSPHIGLLNTAPAPEHDVTLEHDQLDSDQQSDDSDSQQSEPSDTPAPRHNTRKSKAKAAQSVSNSAPTAHRSLKGSHAASKSSSSNQTVDSPVDSDEKESDIALLRRLRHQGLALERRHALRESIERLKGILTEMEAKQAAAAAQHNGRKAKAKKNKSSGEQHKRQCQASIVEKSISKMSELQSENETLTQMVRDLQQKLQLSSRNDHTQHNTSVAPHSHHSTPMSRRYHAEQRASQLPLSAAVPSHSYPTAAFGGLMAALNGANCPLARVTLNGVFLDSNVVFEEVTGWRNQELAGKRVYQNPICGHIYWKRNSLRSANAQASALAGAAHSPSASPEQSLLLSAQSPSQSFPAAAASAVSPRSTIVPQEAFKLMREHITQNLQPGSVARLPASVMMPNGARLHFMMSVSVVRDEQGIPLHTFVMATTWRAVMEPAASSTQFSF